jgi:hypothetical protein
MKTLKDCGDRVAELLSPVITEPQINLTNNDLICFNAICGYAALQIYQQDDDSWMFSEAAESLGITGFDGCPEFNPENNEAIYYDAWWASDFTRDEWMALSEWCLAELNDRKNSVVDW